MAYNKSERFQDSHKRFRIFDPGAYQYPNAPLIQPNKAPFLSKTLRGTTFNKIWTHALHFPRKQDNIPNCTSLQSTMPRFSYEVEKPEAVEEVLCDCDSNNACTCSERHKAEEKEPVICQGEVPRRLFIGPAIPYNIERFYKPPIDVPFYKTKVQELTAFYRGCKWSRWTSRRETNLPFQGPGPADYNLEQPPDMTKICAERVRAKRRKESQQLRFIEIVQRRTIRDNLPGPATYNPIIPERKDFRCPIPTKHKKYYSISEIRDISKDSPGPADYRIPRTFDVKTRGRIECHVKLPNSAPFGVNDVRFKQKIRIGPGPASYCINNFNLCHKNDLLNCNRAPFGSSSKRFKENFLDDDLTEDDDDAGSNENSRCIPRSDQPTWMFKSKTVRMKLPKITLTGTYRNPTENNKARPKKLQYLSPFHSSQGRFRNWYNWIPVQASIKTPGPASYCTEKPKCSLIVFTGTISRQRRFMTYNGSDTPAPNQFALNGIEHNILNTFNYKLRENIRKRCKRRCCLIRRHLDT